MVILFIALFLQSEAFSTPTEKRAQAATTAWTACLKEKVMQYSASSEPVDTLATAAMGSCQTVEDEARSAWLPLTATWAGVRVSEENTASMDKMRAQLRERVVASLVDARAKPK